MKEEMPKFEAADAVSDFCKAQRVTMRMSGNISHNLLTCWHRRVFLSPSFRDQAAQAHLLYRLYKFFGM